jgi:Asp-tRNA(Asn)/Glu-tRNA(Gln) amidotransferase A subunit family amidase
MAKDVESLALLMDVMHGSDEEDEKSEYRYKCLGRKG